MQRFFSGLTRVVRKPFQEPKLAVVLGVVVVGLALLKSRSEGKG